MVAPPRYVLDSLHRMVMAVGPPKVGGVLCIEEEGHYSLQDKHQKQYVWAGHCEVRDGTNVF